MIVKDYRFAWRTAALAAISASPNPICAANGKRPTSPQFLYLFCVNREMMERVLGGKPLVRWLQVLRHWLNRNTRRQARKNIHAHYDLGNAFYSAWLDPTMTYSSALFDAGSNDLAAAQLRKYQSLAQPIELKRGEQRAGDRLRLGRLRRICRQDL